MSMESANSFLTKNKHFWRTQAKPTSLSENWNININIAINYKITIKKHPQKTGCKKIIDV